jgi:ABC-type transporter Mla maintaining outer membrane lipid asymmetry ATPase subunit MlaF
MVRTLLIVCVSVPRAEITNIFGPKDSRQDTTLLACATMLLSNERNYCRTSGQRVKALRLSESSLHLIRREGGVHHRRGSVGSRAHRASGAR